MRNLKKVLEDDLGLDMAGWTLREAWDVSDDGLTIVGFGTNRNGDTEAWMATIPRAVPDILPNDTDADEDRLSAVLVDGADDWVAADGIRAARAEWSLDDGDPCWEEVGGDWSDRAREGAYQGDYRAIGPGSGANVWRWELGGLAVGSYEVFATWSRGMTRGSGGQRMRPLRYWTVRRRWRQVRVNQEVAPQEPEADGAVWKTLTAGDVAAEDFFGTAVSISGNSVIVGAPGHDTINGEDAGSAHVFQWDGTAWTQVGSNGVTPDDGEAWAYFGNSVSISGDYLGVLGGQGDKCVVDRLSGKTACEYPKA